MKMIAVRSRKRKDRADHGRFCQGVIEQASLSDRTWRMVVGAIVLLVGFFPLSVASGFSEEAARQDPAVWRVGLARAEITPTEPIWMAGYAARNRPSEGVLHPLFAKAMLLEDSQGNRGLILSLDLIGFRDNVTDEVCRQIQERTGLAREQILICFSHTHTGPIVNLGTIPGYSVDEANRAVIERYTRRLIEQLGDLAAQAASQLREARLSWGTGLASFVMNRREFTDRGVRLGVNPRGYVDRSVPVLKVASPSGETLAVLFGYACHNTTLTGQHYVISGDYAGFAQAVLEEQLAGVQAMFITGCGGDANPYPRGEIEHAKQHGQTLAAAVLQVLQGELQPIRGPLKLRCQRVDLPLQQLTREELQNLVKGPDYLAGNARRMLEMLDKGESLPKTFPATVAVWQFAEDLTLVALPAEVVSDYVILLDSALGHLRLWIAAYCHETFGYIPSAKVLAEGGYECRGVYVAPGFFAPETEKVIAETVREMAASLGRKVPESWHH
jgi:hypothetical protein